MSLLDKLADKANMRLVVATAAGRNMLHGMALKAEGQIAEMERALAQAHEELRLIREWLGEVQA